MSSASNSPFQYVLGGALHQDSPSYVVRQADGELYSALKASNYCYVFNSRQMGKSSLRVRTMQRLKAEGIACGVVEVAAIVEDSMTSEQFYLGVMRRLSRSLGLKVKTLPWWRERDGLPPIQRFSEFIEDVLLQEITQPIVIFIDEIDSLFKFDFNDDFFALIRTFYQERSDHLDYRRLSFVLLGVATPSDLIRDKQRTSFNIGGQFIDLKGFQAEETKSLEIGLALNAENPAAVMAKILHWTGGQPFLTQRICQLIVESSFAIAPSSEPDVVAQIVQSRIIDDWEAQDESVHLKTIRDRLLAKTELSGRLLGLYQRILQKEEILADSSEEQIELRLSGLIREKHRFLSVANPIYQAVFNQNWVETALLELRPYGAAMAAWLASNQQDESYLLQDQDLQAAREWAEGKRLDDADRLFLDASQELSQRELRSILSAEQQAKAILEAANQKAEVRLQVADEQLKATDATLRQKAKQLNLNEQKLEQSARRLKLGGMLLAVTLLGAVVATGIASNQISATKLAYEANRRLSEKNEELGTENEELGTENEELDTRNQQLTTENENLENAATLAKAAKARAEQTVIEAQQQLTKAEEAEQAAVQKVQAAQKAVESAQQDLGRVNRDKQAAEILAQEAKDAQLKAANDLELAQAAVERVQDDLLGAEQTLTTIELEQAGIQILQKFRNGEQIEALLQATQSGQALRALVKEGAPLNPYPTNVLRALQTILDSIQIENQLVGHQGPIKSVSFSPTGEQLATVGFDKKLILWDSSGQRQREWLVGSNRPNEVRFSPDGQHLATLTEDGVIQLWNVWGDLLSQWQAYPPRSTHRLDWDRFYANSSNNISFHPDGKTIVTGGPNIQLWDWDGNLLEELRGHSQPITSVSFSKNGQYLLSVGKEVLLWDLSKREPITLAAESTGFAVFSSDGQRVVASRGNNTAKIWDLLGNELIHISGIQQWANVHFSPDNHHLMTAQHRSIWLWDIRSSNPEFVDGFSHPTLGFEEVAFSPNGNQIALAGVDGILHMLSVPSLRQSRSRSSVLLNRGGGGDIAFSPDGTKIAITEGYGVNVYGYPSGQLLQRFSGPGWSVLRTRFSPDGQYIAGASRDGYVYLWDLSSGVIKHTLVGLWNAAGDVGFSPDGQKIVTATSEGGRVWSLEGKELMVLQGDQGNVFHTQFGPNGQYIATGGQDGTVHLWSTTGELVDTLEDGRGQIRSISFSPDGQWLAIADQTFTIRLWNIESKEIKTLLENAAGINSLSFSSNGQYLVSTNDSSEKVRIWNLEEPLTIDFNPNHGGPSRNAIFTPDGQHIASIGQRPGATRLWKVDGFRSLDQLINQSCEWLKVYISSQTNTSDICQYD